MDVVGKGQHRISRLKLEGNVLSCEAEKDGGFIVMSQSLCDDENYFEFKILSTDPMKGFVAVGLVPFNYMFDRKLPGHNLGNIFLTSQHSRLRIFKGGVGTPIYKGPQLVEGDRVGCGVRGVKSGAKITLSPVEVYFTRNGDEIKSVKVLFPKNSLHPFIYLDTHTIELTPPNLRGFAPPSDDFMLVDEGDEDWDRTHDVRINGAIIEYAGDGVHIHDVGLAQSRAPLSSANHFFQLEVLEPGKHCYIAIGLVHKNYPLHRHPGWNVGSIAYHADDGKIFTGRGQGAAFGPRCYRGDIMGCGIQFPHNYMTPSDGEDDFEDEPPEGDKKDGGFDWLRDKEEGENPAPNLLDDLLDDLDEGWSDEEWDPGWKRRVFPRAGGKPANLGLWQDVDPMVAMRKARRLNMMLGPQSQRIYGGKGLMVKVFFTRNGERVGHKEVMMPKAGFYPAVGMLSSNEKVKVDLRPLTG